MPAPLTLATRQPSPCGVETAAGHFWLAPDFGALPDAARRDTTARVALCERLDAAPRKAEAAAAEALRPVAGRVLSARTILNLWRGKWVATGRDWRSLIDRARWPDAERRRHDPAFVAHWHQLCWRFKGERRHRRAYRELERQWRAGEAMPGLADFAPGGRPGPLPEGCSYATLMRPPCRPTRLADRVANVGLKAAAPLLPGVLSTRAGLPFG
ncbi:MAG: hypothetical protein LBC18_03205, partial [Opitutaceae bacterium]|nr:hypothetical protein [Opitutaceae bacterium]